MISTNARTGADKRELERQALPADRQARSSRRGLFCGSTYLLILALIALASCATSHAKVRGPTATTAASATATPSATPAPQLVYQADWSHGLAGWQATQGWTVSGGALQTDTGSDRQFTIPFQPATPDYAVEVTLQVISVSKSDTDPKQFDLSADSTSNADGFVALFDHITLNYTLFPSHPHEVIYIDPMLDTEPNPFDIHDYEPKSHALTYRIEVRGPFARLFINDRLASWAQSAKTQTLTAGPLHFYCTGVQLRLSDLKVYTL